MGTRVTSVDVAKKANVSQATVSRILCGKAKFTQETIDRVKEAAKELGYMPNVLASSLNSNKTNLIAVVSVKTTNPFVYETMSIVSQYLRKANKKILYIEVEEEHNKKLDEILEDVMGYQVDGIIVLYAAISKESVELVRRVKIPLVVFNRIFIHDKIFSVSSDNSEGGRMVANYLVKKGYKHFGCITSSGIDKEGSHRFKYFVERLTELGYDDIMVAHCEDYSYENGEESARELLSNGKKLDALFCDSDILALGAMGVIKNEVGLRIPEDIAIVGFDDIQIANWQMNSLTSVRHDNEGMIKAAFEYIEDINNGVARRDKIQLFECEIIERQSS